MIRLLSVAMPLTACAVTEVVPPAKTPPGIVRGTVELSLVTTLPDGFSTDTFTAGAKGEPAVPVVGVCVKASLLAAVGETTENRPFEPRRIVTPAAPIATLLENVFQLGLAWRAQF